MRTTRIKIALLSVMLCLPVVLAWGTESADDVRLEKEESISYPVKSIFGVQSIIGKLKLEMSHGDITLLTWDKDEVRLESKITVVAKNRKIAEQTVDARRVKVTHESTKQVSGKIWNEYRFNCPTASVDGKSIKQAKVEWTVYIPKNKLQDCTIGIDCSFGSVDMPVPFHGKMFLVDVAHGSLNISKLTDNFSNLNSKGLYFVTLKHSNMNMGACGGEHLDLNLQHSNLNLGTVRKVAIKSAHSNFNLGSVEQLKCNAAHSNISIGKLLNNELNLAHSSLEVKNAEEEVALKSCVHSNIVFKSLVKGLNAGICEHSSLVSTLTDAGAFTGFDVNAGFSRLQLIVPENLKAQCDISNVHGSIKMDVSNKKGKHIKGDHTNGFCTSYKGVIGTSTDAKPVIRITNRHGEIQIKD